jgi:hypothetical protein
MLLPSPPLLTCHHHPRYNDKAPLENHHLAAAFYLMRKPEYNFLAGLPKAEADRFRKLVIELVLATDMKQHFSILSHFTTAHRLSQNSATLTATSDAHGHSQYGRMSDHSGVSGGLLLLLLPPQRELRCCGALVLCCCATWGVCCGSCSCKCMLLGLPELSLLLAPAARSPQSGNRCRRW